jgi:hypothetical protein
LLERGGGTHHRDAQILSTRLAQQAASVQQSFASIEVKFNAGHVYQWLGAV